MPHRAFPVDDLGDRQIAFIEQDLLPHLAPFTRKEELEYRVAPSVLIRSECELFAVSSPRFAIRAYLPDGGFLNLRRLAVLRETVDGWAEPWPTADAKIKYSSKKPHPRTHVEHLLGLGGACIADSLLMTPERFAESYNVLTTDLSCAYGEPSANATPYVRHVDLGGGMCAQACVFMASQLLHKHASAIAGLPDISAIAAGIDDRCGVLALGGLKPDAISKCLDAIGLSGPVLSAPSPDTIGGLSIFGSGNQLYYSHMLGMMLRAYVASGMPVIALVESSELWWGSNSILDRNLGRHVRPSEIVLR